MKEMSPEALARHRRFLEAQRRHVSSEAEVVFSLLEVFEGKVFLEMGYPSIYDYALLEVGFEVEKTEGLLRVGRALRALPLLSGAFSAGLVGRSKLREIVRVASASTEAAWLSLAKGSSYREIEALVRKTSKGFPPGVLAEGDVERPLRRRLSCLLREETVALLEEAIEALRGEGEGRLDLDAAVVALVARAGLGKEKTGEEALEDKPSRAFDPRRRPWLLLDACRCCKKVRLQTRTGEVEVSDAVRETLTEGALVIDARALVREAEAVYAARPKPPRGTSSWRSRREHVPAVVERAVFARARFRCEVPGCTERKFLEVGHIVNWFKQDDSLENLCCLCRAHNRAHDEGRIEIRGPYSRLTILYPKGRELTFARMPHSV
jgi:hypothetical protein